MAKLAGPVPADDLNALMKDFIPAGRIGTKADVALMVCFSWMISSEPVGKQGGWVGWVCLVTHECSPIHYMIPCDCQAVYLASDAAVWITGETVVVDGGAWLNRGRRIPKVALHLPLPW